MWRRPPFAAFFHDSISDFAALRPRQLRPRARHERAPCMYRRTVSCPAAVHGSVLIRPLRCMRFRPHFLVMLPCRATRYSLRDLAQWDQRMSILKRRATQQVIQHFSSKSKHVPEHRSESRHSFKRRCRLFPKELPIQAR